MSRCFPYTPRVCVRKGVNGEAALIESIKLQHAKEKSKTSRRREKKKEKSGKAKEESGHGDDKVKPTPSVQKKAKEQRKAGSKRKHSETENERGNEQVERSDLTVERGRPFFSQNTGYLSDSPQSSDKRRSGNALPNHYGNKPALCSFFVQSPRLLIESPKTGLVIIADHPQKSGVIRIRLNLGKQSDQKREAANQQLGKSLAERPTETQVPKPEDNHHPESISAACSDDNLANNFPCLAPHNNASISCTHGNSSSNDGLHGLEIMYRNLTDNWSPLPLQLRAEDVEDDSDWLSGTVQLEKRRKNPSAKLHQSCSSLWPRAQYLSEGGLYALPYTVPF